MAAAAAAHHVPNYDVTGRQHWREPFKDKSHLLSQEIFHPKWLDAPPPVRSRSDLQQARKRGRVPDPSYDFDGDGVVGQLDHFIGRSFDKDNDGHLTATERGRAHKALDNGFLNKYMRGFDSTGHKNRGCSVQQRRGVIMALDNSQDVSVLTYPPHFNAHRVPDVSTRTALQLNRTAELKGAGASFGERFMEENAPITEPQPKNAYTDPRTCPISHVRQRAEADHQASRTRGGLLPMSAPINPEREFKTVGLDRVEQPLFATRGQLMETRKEAMKRECEELRLRGDDVAVPLSVRKTEKDTREFEFRRPDHEPMTMTKLKDARRRERIEYDMQNFAVPSQSEYPRFSDRPDVPFWATSDHFAGGDHLGYEPPRAIAKAASEPTLKVTDAPFGDYGRERELHAEAEPSHAGRPTGSAANFGSNTVKRWTTDMLERGQGRNKPRLFDNIQPVRIGPLDLQSLDLTSSMEPIRNAARNGRDEERKRNTLNPHRSLLYSDSSQMGLSTGTESMKPGSKAHHGGMDGPDGGGKGAGPSRQRHHIVSDPTMRTAVTIERTDKPREPRFFGATVRPSSSIGVRCGGFLKFETPSKQARPLNRSKGGRSDHSKERSRAELKDSMGPSAGTPAAQPL